MVGLLSKITGVSCAVSAIATHVNWWPYMELALCHTRASAQVCVCLAVPTLCSDGYVQCRTLGKINEEGDVNYHEEFERFLRKEDDGIIP